MEGRLFSKDQSLNVQIGNEMNVEWQDTIVDEDDTQDIIVENKDELNHRKKLFNKALKILNPREKEIISLRRLRDKPKKLEELSHQFGISRERVRQIEEKAMEKLQKEISNITK
jgi:RNA polymerase sigma-32 factor